MTIQHARAFLLEWFCGCGDPETACERLRDLLRLCPLYENREALKELVPDDGFEMLLLYTLDHFDLIEHGGSVGGSWLTDKGRDLLAVLNAQHDNFDSLSAQSCIHGYAVETELLDCPECGPLNRSAH